VLLIFSTMDNINTGTAMWSASICCQQSWWYAILTFLHQGDIGVIFRINSDKWNNASIGDNNTFPLCNCRLAVHKILYAMQTMPYGIMPCAARLLLVSITMIQRPSAVCCGWGVRISAEQHHNQRHYIHQRQCVKQFHHKCLTNKPMVFRHPSVKRWHMIAENINHRQLQCDVFYSMWKTTCMKLQNVSGGLSSDWWYTVARCIRRSSHPIQGEICAAWKTPKAHNLWQELTQSTQ